MRSLLLLLSLLLSLPVVPAWHAAHAEEAAEARRVGLVRVRADGPCRIPRARLRALGIADPYRLEVRRDGEALPCFTHEEIGVDPDHVVFAARDTARPHSAYATFELWKLPKPRAVLDVPASLGMDLPRGLALDRFHGPLGAADVAIYGPRETVLPHWFFAVLRPGASVEIPFGTYGATPGSDQTLEVTVHGTWQELATVQATWGGQDLGTVATPDPSREHALRWRVPASRMPAREAVLVLRNTSPPPAPPARHDVSQHRGTLYVDAVMLRGPATYRAPWDKARVVEVEAAGTPADPLASAGRAAHVILATPPLLAGARRLAGHRTASGTPSVAIPVTEVYDRYGHGDPSGDAVVRFVEALRARKGAPLDYLLLAGDATYDRTDIVEAVTIPARMAPTMYNGATPADRRYAAGGATEVGRLPFERAEEMDAFVTRLVRYETQTPTTPTRRMLRFITSPGRFGWFIDNILESRFKRVLADRISPAYDVSVTFANPASPYAWPPASFDTHVLEQLNAGSLFFTYVGHGFEHGFDQVRVGSKHYPILKADQADRVDIRAMPPVVVVLACTTAMFDGLRGPGIGEALMRRPHGPIAYFGATRVCHPGYNALIGESIASHMTQVGDEPRLGAILAAAREDARDPTNRKLVRMAITQLGGAPSERIAFEGAQMYVLLGDPALKLPIPTHPLPLQARTLADGSGVEVVVGGDLPTGAAVRVAVEHPRTRTPTVPHAGVDPADPASVPLLRENHAAANDLGIVQGTATVREHGRATIRLLFDPAIPRAGLLVKAWVEHEGRVNFGGTTLP